MGHNQVHNVDENTTKTDMEVKQLDNESDLEGNEVPFNDSDGDSDTDSGKCDSDAERAEDEIVLWELPQHSEHVVMTQLTSDHLYSAV